jgi:hypothetical protein
VGEWAWCFSCVLCMRACRVSGEIGAPFECAIIFHRMYHVSHVKVMCVSELFTCVFWMSSLFMAHVIEPRDVTCARRCWTWHRNVHAPWLRSMSNMFRAINAPASYFIAPFRCAPVSLHLTSVFFGLAGGHQRETDTCTCVYMHDAFIEMLHYVCIRNVRFFV